MHRTAPTRPVDPDAVRAALGHPSRRAVVRTGTWSVPVIAAAMAAPAFAASTTICSSCSGSATPQCLLSGGGGGTCTCGPGLVCVGTGPLNIANVCVGTGLVLVTCQGTPCVGVCISNSGGALSAINTLINGLTTTINLASFCTATTTGSIPTNICVTPVTQGGAGTLGAICLVTTGSGGLIGATLANLVNTFQTALNALGLGPASTCVSPYTCQLGQRVTASTLGAGTCTANGYSTLVGFCRC